MPYHTPETRVKRHTRRMPNGTLVQVESFVRRNPEVRIAGTPWTKEKSRFAHYPKATQVLKVLRSEVVENYSRSVREDIKARGLEVSKESSVVGYYKYQEDDGKERTPRHEPSRMFTVTGEGMRPQELWHKAVDAAKDLSTKHKQESHLVYMETKHDDRGDEGGLMWTVKFKTKGGGGIEEGLSEAETDRVHHLVDQYFEGSSFNPDTSELHLLTFHGDEDGVALVREFRPDIHSDLVADKRVEEETGKKESKYKKFFKELGVMGLRPGLQVKRIRVTFAGGKSAETIAA